MGELTYLNNLINTLCEQEEMHQTHQAAFKKLSDDLVLTAYEMVLESQLPLKSVDLKVELVMVNNKLTIFGGSCLSKTL